MISIVNIDQMVMGRNNIFFYIWAIRFKTFFAFETKYFSKNLFVLKDCKFLFIFLDQTTILSLLIHSKCDTLL